MELLTVPVVMAIVEMVKRTEKIEAKYIPLFSLGLGVLFGLTFVGLSANGLATGVLLGLSASGLYSGGKNTVNNFMVKI